MDVTQRTNSRTVIAQPIPPKHFLTNKALYLVVVMTTRAPRRRAWAILNSLGADWQARRFVEINLNFFILEGLRLPDLDAKTFDALSKASARLSCPDERFADFAAAAVGVEVELLDAEQRETCRVDIDARGARLEAQRART